ncbi:MAG TPA: hypothetical protein VM140_08445 [Burkholderiales bacterium]|nr:hypothetical protein [Burkholderiales bacterium]
MEEEKPFHYLNQEEFLALSPDERIAYLRRVADYLAVRTSLLNKPDKTPRKKR